MSIESIASGVQSAQLRQQIDIAILKTIQDTFEQQGQAAIALLESAAKVAEQAGSVSANHVDTTA